MRFACLAIPLVMLTATLGRAETSVVRILPRDTDAQIGATFNLPHFVYVDRQIVVDQQAGLPRERHQLLVFLPGTGGSGRGGSALCALAASLGYHALSLTYPTDVAAAMVCRDDADPNAFESFRTALIAGGHFKGMFIARPDSIENRLNQLIRFLAVQRPREHWSQFLTDKGDARWSAIALAGQSQGGGHAALLAMKHEVARVLCFGAPKDYSRRLQAPAAWYSLPSRTPPARFFAFNHTQDRQGCTPVELLENVRRLGLGQFGPAVDVATHQPPYDRTHILLTSLPQTTDSRIAHGAVISPARANELRPVWTYLLTAGP